jgi:DNA-binding HxlR family transcriptional regulator
MSPEIFPRPCTIASALNVLGEKWSLLVVRELALNVHRFDILTSRLRRLEAEGVLEKRLYQEHPPRYEYYLTEAGDELRPILLSLAQWGERWTPQKTGSRWVHTCGHEVDVVHTCDACGEEVTGLDLRLSRASADVV